MPCNSDYMEPNHREKASLLAAENLLYVYRALGVPRDEWLYKSVKSPYGNVNQLGEMFARLCEACGSMSKEQEDRIIYDGRNDKARKLAAWWDEHKKADKKRNEQEALEIARFNLRSSALEKLSSAEREALGL